MQLSQQLNGKVRVCINLRPLNVALHQSHYPLPVIDDILPDLGKRRDRNITLNKAKFNFNCQQVTFIGHLLSSEEVKPDPSKINAIVIMKTLGMQRLIRMVKYLLRFLVSNLSELCQPLRKFTQKDAEWQWTQEQDYAFQSLKVAVTQATVLKYFSPEAQTERQGDALQNGLGFLPLQKGQPVTYARGTLTSSSGLWARAQSPLHIWKISDFVDWPQSSAISLQEASHFSSKTSTETSVMTPAVRCWPKAQAWLWKVPSWHPI